MHAGIHPACEVQGIAKDMVRLMVMVVVLTVAVCTEGQLCRRPD